MREDSYVASSGTQRQNNESARVPKHERVKSAITYNLFAAETLSKLKSQLDQEQQVGEALRRRIQELRRLKANGNEKIADVAARPF